MEDWAQPLPLNAHAARPGRYVLYWMQAAQRASCNPALEYAIAQANARGLPVVAAFGLTPHFPSANARHYRFMLDGLCQAGADLAARGILLALRRGEPDAVAAELAADAALVVVDRGELRVQRRWYTRAAAAMACPLLQVETNTVVPLARASMREEYAARTLRPKIRRELAHLLRGWHEAVPRRVSLGLDVAAEPFDVEALLAGLGVEPMAPAVWRGGTGQARAHLVRFLQRGLDRYAAERNDPLAEAVSNQSPYLHFGQISPLEVALQVQAHGGPGAEAYLEELIVRRELAANMVHYNPGYDCYEQAVPAWAQATLAHHAGDDREWHYSAGDLAAGRTHDAYWNAAQREMVLTGKMHGYMRMYWGKQLIAWAGSPRAAFELALALNDRYELDGRDPNGYAGVAWCFGKHDRPWPERSIYGHVRTMTAGGLRRKFDMAAYVARVAALDAAGNVQAPQS